MHDSSFIKMQTFVATYLRAYRDVELEILDFGSQEVEGQPQSSYRSLFTCPKWRYRGLDMVSGANVDIVVTNPFLWEAVEEDSIDVVISGQALEHVDYFWISAFEIGRVLKPGGIGALIAPSAGPEHRYPLDCWRYYTDGFEALARFLGFQVLDVYTDWGRGTWADSMLVMRKPLWDLNERHNFRRSLEHQRAVLAPDSFSEPLTEISPPIASALKTLEGGKLSQLFDAHRSADRPSTLTRRVKGAARELLGDQAVHRLKSMVGRSRE